MGLSVSPSSAVLALLESVSSSQPLLTPAMRLTASLAAQVARTPVWVNGMAPNRIEWEALTLVGVQITSLPCRVTNLPAITVNGPVEYWRKAWVTSNIDPVFALVNSGNEWITWASLPTVILTRPPKPSLGCFATDRPNWRRANELFSRSNTRVENAA